MKHTYKQKTSHFTIHVNETPANGWKLFKVTTYRVHTKIVIII